MNDHNPWTIKGSRTVYDNKWIGVTEYDVLNPSGGEGIYGKVHFKNLAIGVIPLDEDGNTWLVGQYRFPIEAYSWEIPEGGGDPAVSPVISAARELEEETGLRAAKWQEILKLHLSNSVSDEVAYIFLARDLTQHAARPEDTEELIIRQLPFAEAFQMVMRGEITDSMSVAGILKLQWLIKEGVIT